MQVILFILVGILIFAIHALINFLHKKVTGKRLNALVDLELWKELPRYLRDLSRMIFGK